MQQGSHVLCCTRQHVIVAPSTAGTHLRATCTPVVDMSHTLSSGN